MNAASRIGLLALSKRTVPLSGHNKSLRFGLLHCPSMPSPHLPDVHLLHLGQRGSLEAHAGPGRGLGPGVGHRQVDTGSRLHVARTRQGKAGHGAKCWGRGGRESTMIAMWMIRGVCCGFLKPQLRERKGPPGISLGKELCVCDLVCFYFRRTDRHIFIAPTHTHTKGTALPLVCK